MEHDSKILMKTLKENLEIAIPNIEFTLIENGKCIRGERTLLVFEYSHENLSRVCSSLDSKLKDILGIEKINF